MNKKARFSQPLKKQTLAEQVAEAIQESILAGDWQGGEALPTEPELSAQFGVSRAVIRDATRMLAAQGLVEAQHGKGVFVTHSQSDAFGAALLLALRRAGASVWDVEQFEQTIYPDVCALAAREASEAELDHIREMAEAYIAVHEQLMQQSEARGSMLPEEQAQLRAAYRAFNQTIFAATHNQVLTLLAQPLTSLRNLRNWEDIEDRPSKEEAIRSEQAYFRKLVETIATRDPEQVRSVVIGMMALPAEVEEAMRQTAVGEVPNIPRGLFFLRSLDD